MSVAVGTSGFVAWLYAVIYNMVRNACKTVLRNVMNYVLHGRRG